MTAGPHSGTLAVTIQKNLTDIKLIICVTGKLRLSPHLGRADTWEWARDTTEQPTQYPHCFWQSSDFLGFVFTVPVF